MSLMYYVKNQPFYVVQYLHAEVGLEGVGGLSQEDE